MEYDFSGYVTKAGLECTDGRTIMRDAFKHQDGIRVPLVWQHDRTNPDNVLGHVMLENRDDGMYGYAYLNGTDKAKTAKELIVHEDINSFSIWANELRQRAMDVIHGKIREVSLVLAGANPGAIIDNLNFQHGESYMENEEEAIIKMNLGLELFHSEDSVKEEVEESNEDETVEDVLDSLNEKQRDVVYALLEKALDHEDDGEDASHSNENSNDSDTEGNDIVHNIFEGSAAVTAKAHLSHDQMETIFTDADTNVKSLKKAVLKHAGTYGIDNIEVLFPDAVAIRNTPDFVKRQTEWVEKVMGPAHKSPFSRIKSMSADITLDTARAKGYIKGNLKKDEFFAILSRVTLPKTIYKKQKLDRDDIIDITSFDVVAWIKAEMQVMLREEIARAILIGDGRAVDDEDKINENNLRPIVKDHEFYTHRVNVAVGTSGEDAAEAILRARKYFKGSGSPTLFTTEDFLLDMLLAKDKMGRRLYRTTQELAAEIRVGDIVPVEVMEGYVDDDGHELLGVEVNMRDYTVGADKGGQTSFFDDFDIDYNQYKYLYEARLSGALTLPKSAISFWRGSGTLADPADPVKTGNSLAIPTVAGVSYFVDDVEVSGNYVMTEDTIVEARPDAGYYFAAGTDNDWAYTYTP